MSIHIKLYAKDANINDRKVNIGSNVELMIGQKKVILENPFPSTIPIYYKVSSQKLEISDDLRLLIDKRRDRLCHLGITSLLMFGVSVPPLTPFEGIKAFMPGFRYEIDLATFNIKNKPCTKWTTPLDEDMQRPVAEQIEILSSSIRQQLVSACPTHDPILLFSGGVDSSALAMQIALLGWKDANYIHCSVGKGNAETKIAREIADRLGFRIDIVEYDADVGLQLLEEVGAIYRHPFGDHSCVAINCLVNEIITRFDNRRVIIDGNGADSAFGLFNKIKKSKYPYIIPYSLRRLAGECYKPLNLLSNTSKIEFYTRILRRTSSLSAPMATIAQNPLFGILYNASKKDINELDELSMHWITSIATTHDMQELVPLLGLGLLESQQYAQKTKYPLEAHSYKVEYPFQTEDIVDLALYHSRFWEGYQKPKNALKHMLLDSVPPELIYRQKVAFKLPLHELFSRPIFLKHIEAATNSDSLIIDHINKQLLVRIIHKLKKNIRLPSQTYNCLWMIAFLNSWLTQAPDASMNINQALL